MNSSDARSAARLISSPVCSSYILTMACDQPSSSGPSSTGTPSSVQITATEYGWA